MENFSAHLVFFPEVINAGDPFSTTTGHRYHKQHKPVQLGGKGAQMTKYPQRSVVEDQGPNL